MNKDIRIAVSFKGHRKRKKIERMLGQGATSYLIDLWITVAQDSPEGVLNGWDEEDIASSAGWIEDPLIFVNALITCGFLTRLECGTFQVHDWCDHQGYACKAKERSEQARIAAEARWKTRFKE